MAVNKYLKIEDLKELCQKHEKGDIFVLARSCSVMEGIVEKGTRVQITSCPLISSKGINWFSKTTKRVARKVAKAQGKLFPKSRDFLLYDEFFSVFDKNSIPDDFLFYWVKVVGEDGISEFTCRANELLPCDDSAVA